MDCIWFLVFCLFVTNIYRQQTKSKSINHWRWCLDLLLFFFLQFLTHCLSMNKCVWYTWRDEFVCKKRKSINLKRNKINEQITYLNFQMNPVLYFCPRIARERMIDKTKLIYFRDNNNLVSILRMSVISSFSLEHSQHFIKHDYQISVLFFLLTTLEFATNFFFFVRSFVNLINFIYTFAKNLLSIWSVSKLELPILVMFSDVENFHFCLFVWFTHTHTWQIFTKKNSDVVYFGQKKNSDGPKSCYVVSQTNNDNNIEISFRDVKDGW